MSEELDEATSPLDTREALGVDEIIRRLQPRFTITIPSRRNSGKSYLTRELVQELIRLKKVDIVIVLSGTCGLTKDWDFLPEGCVMGFSEAVLTRIWNHQEKAILEGDKDVKHVLIVLDDCLSNPDALRNPVIESFYSKGRHAHTSMIIISQHTAHLLTPIIRANSDLIIWSKLNIQQLKALHNSTTVIQLDDFLRVAQTLGGVDFNFLVLDNYIRSKDPLDFLTVVRAKPRPGK